MRKSKGGWPRKNDLMRLYADPKEKGAYFLIVTANGIGPAGYDAVANVYDGPRPTLCGCSVSPNYLARTWAKRVQWDELPPHWQSAFRFYMDQSPCDPKTLGGKALGPGRVESPAPDLPSTAAPSRRRGSIPRKGIRPMASRLNLHSGGTIVDRAALDGVIVPAPTETWFPVAHGDYLDAVHDLITGAGFRIRSETYSLMDGRLPSGVRGHLGGTDGASLPVPGGRFFGVIDLDTSLSDGAALTIGLRNSLDQSFAMGFVAGSRVFVCSNLAFSGELLVSRKHTVNGLTRLREAVIGAVGRLDAFAAAEREAIRCMRATQLDARDASHLILEGFRRGITGARLLPAVLKHWADPAEGARVIEGTSDPDPAHAEALRDQFGPRNAWSLYNAHTSAYGDVAARQPHRHADATMRLRALFAEVIGNIPAVSEAVIPTMRDTDEADPLD